MIPTFNSQRVLADCLASIQEQDYPKEKVEILVVDGGSTDSTLMIASRFNARVLRNPLRTGEAGKAVGIAAADSELILLQDSDNILDRHDWLLRMVEPLADPSMIGSEPLYYSYRKGDSFITRYCALLGMNDPICLYLGNYDRYSYVTRDWTGLPIKTEDKGSYLAMTLRGEIPTIGANGFLVRAAEVKTVGYTPYFFDIDAVYGLMRLGSNRFAKVKIGIAHVFADGVRMFGRKTLRRIRDYVFYSKQGMRSYPWDERRRLGLPRFLLYSVLLFPTVKDSVRGYRNRPDMAWFFHPVACLLTVLIYGSVYVTRIQGAT